MKHGTYKSYLLWMLMAVLALSYTERVVFGVSLQDIKTTLRLSDTQLGFLSGIAHAVFFSLAGIPIARWADRGHRVAIISLTTAFWGVTVAISGMVGSFTQLFWVRSGIAAGEAGCFPAANSLIPDYFARGERPRAVARYMLGVPLGLIIGYFTGGWLDQVYGWRTTFVVVSLPGFALALLSILTLDEPRCHSTRSAQTLSTDSIAYPSLNEVIASLSSNATFRHLLLCFLVWYFCGWALVQWLPTFFVRSHAMATGEVGTWLAVACGGGQLLGTYIGGEWAARHAGRNERLQLICAAALFSLVVVCFAVCLLASNQYEAFAALAVAFVANSAANGPLFALVQTLVPSRMRATALAVVSVLPLFVGMGLGPLAAGTLSDQLHPWMGGESLRYALLVFCPGYFWAAWHLWRASRTVFRDIAAVDPDRTLLLSEIELGAGERVQSNGLVDRMHRPPATELNVGGP